MVYGTLGPLLHEPRLQYVKGYYQRPIVQGGVLREGGGRVTELVAQPLINLFFPELSGFVQPLAGEYAGRRSVLERIPVFTGYAIEIERLIDVAERSGLDGLGQGRPRAAGHRNQELEGLWREMSFVILQAVMNRIEERRKARLFAELRLDDEAAARPTRPVPRSHRAGRHGTTRRWSESPNTSSAARRCSAEPAEPGLTELPLESRPDGPSARQR